MSALQTAVQALLAERDACAARLQQLEAAVAALRGVLEEAPESAPASAPVDAPPTATPPAKTKWRVPPAKPKERDTSPAPASQHTAAIAQIEARLGRALGVKETTAAEVLLDGGSIHDVASALSLSYGGAYSYAQKLGLTAKQNNRPPRRKGAK